MELVEQLTEVSLKELEEDIDHYLDVEKEEKLVKQKGIVKSLVGGFGDLNKSIGSGFGLLLGTSIKDAGRFRKKIVFNEAKSSASGNCILAYDIFKKAHRMMTW